MLAAEAVGLLGKQSLSATQEQLPGSHSGGQQRCRRRQLLRRSGQRHLSPLPQRWEQQGYGYYSLSPKFRGTNLTYGDAMQLSLQMLQ